MRFVAFAASALLSSGCYLSHEVGGSTRDGGAPDGPDARDVGTPGPRDASAGDAPRSGRSWRLERADATLVIPHEIGCTQYEGGRIAVQVFALIPDVCHHAGPVRIEHAGDGTVLLTAYLWVEDHGGDPDACPGITARSERTFLFPAREGVFRAETSTAAVEIRSGAIDDLPCTRAGRRGEVCLVDCQCEGGLVCIPELGDVVACEGGRCGDPCNTEAGTLAPVYGQHLECPPTDRCTWSGGLAMPACAPIDDEGCRVRGCALGLGCAASVVPFECAWELEYPPGIPCTTDADCAEHPGLLCVAGPGGGHTCEVPCFTNEQSCPAGGVCHPDLWICWRE